MQKVFALVPSALVCHMLHPSLSCPQVMRLQCFVLGFECASHFLPVHPPKKGVVMQLGPAFIVEELIFVQCGCSLIPPPALDSFPDFG